MRCALEQYGACRAGFLLAGANRSGVYSIGGRDGRNRCTEGLCSSCRPSATPDRGAPVYLILGTSGDAGKTTAGVAVLQTLRAKGHASLLALKATGTASFEEIARYLDFGATHAFDCVDFGLPTTYPSGRDGIREFFEIAIFSRYKRMVMHRRTRQMRPMACFRGVWYN